MHTLTARLAEQNVIFLFGTYELLTFFFVIMKKLFRRYGFWSWHVNT